MSRAVGLVLAVVVAMVALMQVDEPRDASVTGLLSRLDDPARRQSNAYVELMGIVAPVGDEPALVGKRRADGFRTWNSAHLPTDTQTPKEPFPQENWLPSPSALPPCDAADSPCLVQRMRVHDSLLSRYHNFLDATDYRTMSQPRFTEVLPPYEYIAEANRLVIGEALSLAASGQPDDGIFALVADVAGLRNQLVQADTIVGKMVLVRLISRDIDAAAQIVQRFGFSKKGAFPELDERERALALPFAREFASFVPTYEALDRNPGFWDAGSSMPGWFVRIFYKPNMTLNVEAAQVMAAIGRSTLPAPDFAAALPGESVPAAFLSRLRNSAGNALQRETSAASRMDAYTARLHDLNGKILMFNALVATGTAQGVIDRVRSPYGTPGAGPHWSGDQQSLCLDGPLPDDYGLRCLPVVHEPVTP